MEKLTTVLHTYSFDVRTPDGKAEWKELKAKLEQGPHCHGPVFADCYHFVKELDGKTVELETAYLFDNQWNTAPVDGVSNKGLRVFDWALEAAYSLSIGAPRGIRRGHYLEQTPQMREVRRNTMKCGYCGKQEPAAKGYVFCPHCIDSEYLKESGLKLTRMRPVADSGLGSSFPELTAAEREHLLPLYMEAQLHGTTERGKARIARERREVAEKYASIIRTAKAEHDGFLWLMDRGFRTDNVIYYTHTEKFCFGWRSPLDADVKSRLLDVLSEFPFDYEFKSGA